MVLELDEKFGDFLLFKDQDAADGAELAESLEDEFVGDFEDDGIIDAD